MLVNDGGIATQPRAPGHDRPFTASTGAAKHGRLRAATRAPGADVPPATPAEAPGQHRLRAALLAPGHDRPRAALRATRHDRPSAATRAPGADVPPATPAEAPGQHRPSAMANATVALPAGPHRPRQEDLPHNPANPRTLTNPYSRFTASSLRRKPQSSPRPAAYRRADSPSLLGKGPGVRSTSHQVHPAIQVPPHPRPCSTAQTGLSQHHLSRAPPYTCPSNTNACRHTDSPSPRGRGPG